jgi:ribosome maturation protein SDO1
VRDALLAPHIYKSAQTGMVASEEHLTALFKTSDEEKVAERIIKEGELHFNDEYKERLRSEKKKQIIDLLVREAAEVNSGNPVTEKKLASAFSQAKVHVDLFKRVEEQVPDVVAKLRSVLALSLDKKTLSLRIPSKHAPKLYGFVSSKSTILQEAWLGDGAFSAKVELAAGAVSGFIDELKKSTHGDIEVSIEQKKSK